MIAKKLINKLFSFSQKSIFTKLVVAFIIMLIPVYFIGINIYQWGTRTVENEITSQKLSQLRFYLGSIEEEIARVKLLQWDYINGYTMNVLHNRGKEIFDYEKSYNIIQIRKDLLSMKNSCIYIKEIVAYIPNVGKKISSNTGLEEFTYMDYPSYNKYSNTTSSNLYSSEEKIYINTAYPLSHSVTGIDPYYSLRIELSIQELTTWLTQFDSHNNSGTILFRKNADLPYIYTGNDQEAKIVMSNIQGDPNIGESQKVILNGDKYLVTHAYSEYSGLILCNYVSADEIFLTVRKNQSKVWVLTLSSIIIIAMFTIYIYLVVQQPMKRLIHAFGHIDQGDMEFQIRSNKKDEFRYLYDHFNKMIRSINNLIDHNYKQKLMLRNAELGQLQAQINPHFIYNSYFLLNRMVKSDDRENAIQFSKQMGIYFQFITKNQRSVVSLSKEIEHARIYTEIQAKRFEGRLAVDFPPTPYICEMIFVPKLIIQPILENAFEYAFSDMLVNGLLHVHFVENEGILQIHVDDNGENVTNELIEKLTQNLSTNYLDENSIGIINIHKRLKLHFGNESGLIISRAPIGGLRVSICIKKGEEGI